MTAGTNECNIDQHGCATDGPGTYGAGERCTFQVNAAGTLTATQFQTERHHDNVTIGAHTFDGAVGPSNVVVAAGSTIAWRSDHSVSDVGFTICFMPSASRSCNPD